MKKTKTINYDIFDCQGKKLTPGSLVDPDFTAEKIPELIAQVIRVYLFNQGQKNASTKTRGEVTGSTRKIYRQKGTGRARHGDIKAPIFVGGGIVFGPKSRDVKLKMSKKMKSKAFKISVLDKIINQKLIAVSGLEAVTAKTKEFVKITQKIFGDKTIKGKILLINGLNKNLLLAARNVSSIDLVPVDTVNTYDILSHEQIIIDQNIIDKFAKRLQVESKQTVEKPVKKVRRSVKKK